MIRTKTFLHGVASLIRIQSTPVTVLTLVMGYGVVSDGIFTSDIIPLLVVGALGHWGFYALNDINDYRWDLEEGRYGKPLVSGRLTEKTAWCVSLLLISASLGTAVKMFPPKAMAVWMFASLFGWVYNSTSKIHKNSQLYLGAWGFAVVLTGSLYAGGINAASVGVSLIVGVHMIWMTMMGDLKDVGNGEDSLPEEMGVEISDGDLLPGTRFRMASIKILFIESVLIIFTHAIGVDSITDQIMMVVTVAGALLIITSGVGVIKQIDFDRDSMKKEIAMHEVITIVTVMFPAMSNSTDMGGVLSFVILSVVWGLTWQTILYGHPLRFP